MSVPTPRQHLGCRIVTVPSVPTDSTLLAPLLTRYADRVAARVGPLTEAGCWEWVGPTARAGYGTYSIAMGDGSTRSLRAHRAVFMLFHQRAIAPGMTLHHTCFRVTCVNPAHLVEMTAAENNAIGANGGASIRCRVTKAGAPRWSVLFRDNGKQRSRTFGTLAEAQSFADERTAAP